MKLKNKPYYEEIKERLIEKNNARTAAIKSTAVTTALVLATSGFIFGTITAANTADTATNDINTMTQSTKLTHEYVDYIDSKIDFVDSQYHAGKISEEKYNEEKLDLLEDSQVKRYYEDTNLAKLEEIESLEDKYNLATGLVVMSTLGTVGFAVSTIVQGIGGTLYNISEYKDKKSALNRSVSLQEDKLKQKEEMGD
ncbi:MAG: hypothetical protein IJA61_02525 [Clostridia bacterium]|nr:hypothetical protein [Clostridia bacterium]